MALDSSHYIHGPLTDSYVVVITGCKVVGTINSLPIYVITDTDFVSYGRSHMGSNDTKQDDPAMNQIRALLTNGTFYFSSTADMTLNLQRGSDMWASGGVSDPDKRFYWNEAMQREFLTARLTDWILPIVQGMADNKPDDAVE